MYLSTVTKKFYSVTDHLCLLIGSGKAATVDRASGVAAILAMTSGMMAILDRESRWEPEAGATSLLVSGTGTDRLLASRTGVGEHSVADSRGHTGADIEC